MIRMILSMVIFPVGIVIFIAEAPFDTMFWRLLAKKPYKIFTPYEYRLHFLRVSISLIALLLILLFTLCGLIGFDVLLVLLITLILGGAWVILGVSSIFGQKALVYQRDGLSIYRISTPSELVIYSVETSSQSADQVVIAVDIHYRKKPTFSYKKSEIQTKENRELSTIVIRVPDTL